MSASSWVCFVLKENVSCWGWRGGMLTTPGRRAVLRSGRLHVFNFELEEENYGESWVSDNEVWTPDVQSLAVQDGKAVWRRTFWKSGGVHSGILDLKLNLQPRREESSSSFIRLGYCRNCFSCRPGVLLRNWLQQQPYLMGQGNGFQILQSSSSKFRVMRQRAGRGLLAELW